MGTNLVEHFVSQGRDVINIDATPPRNKALGPYWRQLNILDGDRLAQSIRDADPEYIFHLAARTDLNGKTLDDYAVNTIGVRTMIVAAKRAKRLQRIVFASTRLVCRIGYVPIDEFDYCPNTAYGESKMIGEKIIREEAGKSLPWVNVRPTSIWGPWFGEPYRNFFEAIQKGVYFHPAGKRIRKSFGFVGNSIFALDKLANCDLDRVLGRTLYLCDYAPLEVRKWADLIADEMNVRRPSNVPYGILKVLASCGDLAKRFGYPSPPLTSFRLNNLLTDMTYELKPLEDVCGALPFSVEEGVKISVAWMRTYGNAT